MTTTDRPRWDAKSKREIARQILAGEVDPAEVRKSLKIQSYQLLSAVGQYAIETRDERRRSAPEHEEELLGAALHKMLTRQALSEEEKRQILELCVRKYVL